MALNAGAASPQPQSGDSVEQTILKLEQAWTDAMKNNKPEDATHLFADDAVFTDSDGTVRDKAGELNSMHAVKWESAEDKDMRVVQRGNTVIVTGTFSGKGKTTQGKKVEDSEAWTDVWMKNKQGEWQIVASQDSPITKK